MIFLCLSEL